MEYSVTWGEGMPGDADASVDIIEDKAWFPPGPGSNAPINWWQYGGGMQRVTAERANAVYACRKVLSEEVSRLFAHHYRIDDNGNKVRVRSRLERILRFPNSWQTRVEFWMNLVDRLLRDGNAYALAGRDDTGGITSLTPITQAHPYVDYETGLVFYGVGLDMSQPLPEADRIDPSRMVPASEVMHLRLFTPVHPLIGESPLVAAVVAADTGMAITNSTYAFFNRAARPSGYLRHPKQISKVARERLKDAWTQNYSGSGTGGTAILEEGLEWHPMSMNAVDAEIINQYRLTVEDVARVFRVPLFMLGSMDKATFNNVEQMTRSFIAGGLGFYLNLIEARLGQFFQLGMDEIVEFDVEGGLLRSEFRDRVEGLVRGVQGGIFAPNEARRREGLAEVPHGDQPLVQQQMVPLSYAAQQTVEEVDPPPEPSPEDVPDPTESRAMVRRLLKVA